MIWRLGLAALLWVGSALPAYSQPAAPTLGPAGAPQPGSELIDREFGVGTDQFGLDRRVEMYQWRRTGQDHYDQVWKAAWIDSSEFTDGHQNPPRLPLDSRRWWAPDASVDGKPLDERVLKALGRWEDFRPGFSRLPGNLSATFQPEGDGLISSENPLDPQIGDLRVRWRELLLPSLAGRVELRDGRWQLAPQARAPSGAGLGVDPAPLPAVAKQAQPEKDSRWWLWLLGGLVLVAVVVFARRRRASL